MTLDDLLRSTALDVAEQAPTGHPNLREIEERAQSVRARRRVALVSSVTAAVVLVAVAVRLAGGQTTASVPVVPAPPVTSTPGAPVVVVPKITPDDLRGYDELATVTNEHGQTELTFDVPVRDSFSYDWNFFCSGDRDTWYVLVVGNGGGAASGYCNQAKPEPFPALPADQSPFGHSGEDPTTLRVRMFVTGPIPQQHLDCFDRSSPAECQNVTPPLEPLTSTDVSFGVSVFEYWAPSVAEVAGEAVSALAVVEGTRHVLRQVVTAAPGESHLTLALPAADRGRLVGVVGAPTDGTVACGAAVTSAEENDACTPLLEIRIGDRRVSVERGQFGDLPGFATYPFFRVPASPDGDQELELRVQSGDPGNVSMSLVVFEEDASPTSP